jgi:hypothetical protein
LQETIKIGVIIMLKSGKKRRKGKTPIVNVREAKWAAKKEELLELFNDIEHLQEEKKFGAARILIDEAIRLAGPVYREVQALGSLDSQYVWKKLYDKAWGYSVSNF